MPERPDPAQTLSPELIRDLAACAGLDLALDRAAEVLPLLAPLLQGDARIEALQLGSLPAAGPVWPEVERA